MKNPNIPAWAQIIEGFIPGDGREAAERQIMLFLLAREGDALLYRESAHAHFTASSVIVNRDRTKTLMAYHRIYDSWAWTGGHNDGDSDFLRVAQREAREETGITGLRLLGAGVASLEILPVLAHVRRGAHVGTHLHLNLSYLFEADNTLPLRTAEAENSAVAWLPIGELSRYVSEKDMLPIYARLLSRSERL